MLDWTDRDRYNKECLRLFEAYLKKCPELRFIQALWALNIVDREDRYYEEPDITLEKIINALNQANTQL